jgi:uncharacterized coiled-coil protein SlyX
MSAITPEGLESSLTSGSTEQTVSELVEIVVEQQQQIEELTEQVGDLREELGQDDEEDQDDSEDVDEQVADNTARIDALSNGLSNANDEIEQLRDDTEQIEDVLEDVNPTPDDGETTLHDTLTPIERLTGDEIDVEDVSSSASVNRAVTLFEHIQDWGKKTPKGIVLRPTDSPLALLEAATGEDLCWKQYYRTAETLERLSKGAVTFFDSDRHGKMICLHEQSEVYDRVRGGTVPLTASSEEVTV